MIRDYLIKAGFEDKEISDLPPQITDFQAEAYQGNVKRSYRYMAKLTVTLRSQNVPLVKKTMERSGELVKQGIVLAAQDYVRSTEFLSTALNEIKPDILAEATKNARKAAEQFAKDSDSKVGAIRKARQGQFSIQSSDKNTPDRKKIRVVTTVEYFLKD